MSNGFFMMPKAVNEPVLNYAPGSTEKKLVKAELERQSKLVLDIPLIIGGKEYRTSTKRKIVMPHNHKHVLAEFSIASVKEIELAKKTALEAKETWANMPFEHRASIFLKAAELISTKYRAQINAATMLGQSKTIYQAEIDSACELVDFLRFNVSFAEEIYKSQPQSSAGVWNRMEYRPLDGFVAAVSPFNFTAIGANLCSCPAIMGNTVVWKPAMTAVLSNYYVMKVFMEAGLPDGVINFLPCSGVDAGKHIIGDPEMGGFHFTGSTAVFKTIWEQVGRNINNYRAYPRLVGETGGKDFIFAHKSAALEPLVTAMVRGSFEYQGQKCSAASRAFIPRSMFPDVKRRLMEEIAKIKVGDVSDFTNFMSAVIDEASFKNICSYIDEAKTAKDAELLCGGYDGSVGYFIQPTVILAKKADYRSMHEEIFGPVLTIFVYEDEDFDKTLKICDEGAAYALTGALFAKDREVIVHMEKALRQAAGNFYINDKPTGAVVGQQPFGGARASGTNDKAGSILNLFRWISPRTIKETFNPPTSFEYPFMQEK
ncbi:delta-1-pyrroline-5-carboxylate dehydrogenase 1 isoform a-related [Holotrichia oblita]|nr:delta-1-pyrroline-5-carboxylate dehydrogenase 1 isoform a-related [Holotrichia oblita]